MGLYAHLRDDERARIEAGGSPLDVDAWRLPVWMPGLPEASDARHLVFRALAALSPDERRGAFFAFVAVANAVAVADRMDPADAETTPAAIEKAAVTGGVGRTAEESAGRLTCGSGHAWGGRPAPRAPAGHCSGPRGLLRLDDHVIRAVGEVRDVLRAGLGDRVRAAGSRARGLGPCRP